MTSVPMRREAPWNDAPAPTGPHERLRRLGFTLGAWTVAPRLLRISGDKTVRRLDPRTMDLLVYLASRAGDVVERDELLDAVWGGVYVTENTLTQAVSRLRRALGDSWRRPTYLETISKSGYRLVAPVAPGAAAGVRAWLPTAAATPPAHTGRRRIAVVAALLVAAGAVLWATRREGSPGPPALLAARPALTHVGTQAFASLSPDGSRIAFAWKGPREGSGDAGWDLYVQQIDAEAPHRLTDVAGDEALPAWTPDGLGLAFLHAGDGVGCGIFRMPSAGGAAERLADCLPGLQDLRYTPDGTRLVMSAMPDGQEPRRVVALDVSSGRLEPLTDPPAGIPGDVDPVVSPDGTLLAWSRRASAYRHDLMVMPAAGGAPQRLTHDAWGRLRGLDFTADGRHLVVASNRTGRYRLWRVPVAGGALERLPIEDAWVTLPALARDGSRLIYKTYTDVIDLWRLALDHRGQAVGAPAPVMPSTRSEMDPVLSPDGGSVAFLSDRSGFLELWSGGLDGGALFRHSRLRGPRPGGAAWSPDGGRLVFDAAPDGHADLFAVARDSRRPMRLTRDPADERNPTFSADGTAVLFTSDRTGDWQIYRMPAAGGSAVRVTERGGFLARETPGRDLFVVRPDAPGIWRLPAAGGVPVQVVDELDLADWASWTVRPGGIYFVHRASRAILRQPLDGGARQTVWEAPATLPYLGRAFSVAADERSLVVAMIDRSDDEVLVVDLPR